MIIKKIVTKKCKTRQEYLREIAIYEKSFSFVPRLLAHDYSTLSIEYINGETIGSLANPDFSKLGKIFAGLHSHKNKSSLSICHNDTNPKNYLVDKNGKYFMIDFSDWTFDYPEKDLIHFLMFRCSIYSHKKLKLASELFLNSYQKKTRY